MNITTGSVNGSLSLKHQAQKIQKLGRLVNKGQEAGLGRLRMIETNSRFEYLASEESYWW